MTYAEHLRANGATEEDIKILDTPVAQRAFAKMQSSFDAEATKRAAAEQAVGEYRTWETEMVPYVRKVESDATIAQANEARARAVIVAGAARDTALAQIAKDMGYDVPVPGNPPARTADPIDFDPKKHNLVTMDTLMSVAEREGDAIAIAQDIAYEHHALFPDKPLNFRDLRKEAVSKRVGVEQLWMERFGVLAARDKRAADAEAAKIAAARAEGRKEADTEWASRYGNPDARPLAPSRHALAPRTEGSREKQPWEAGDRSSERVQHATQKVMEQIAAKPN